MDRGGGGSDGSIALRALDEESEAICGMGDDETIEVSCA